jgi:hypothetical protein
MKWEVLGKNNLCVSIFSIYTLKQSILTFTELTLSFYDKFFFDNLYFISSLCLFHWFSPTSTPSFCWSQCRWSHGEILIHMLPLPLSKLRNFFPSWSIRCSTLCKKKAYGVIRSLLHKGKKTHWTIFPG